MPDIAAANNAEALVLVVTNNSVVAWGFFDEEAVKRLHLWMGEALAALGAGIDEFLYCPHHPEGGVERYAHACHCRKLAAGIIEALIAKHDVDHARSFLIGDKVSKLQAAEAAHIGAVMYRGGPLSALCSGWSGPDPVRTSAA